MRIFTFILLATAVILTGCKKEKCLFPGDVVQGRIIDTLNQKGIENAIVALYRYNCKVSLNWSGGVSCDEILIDKTLSDPQGNFNFKFCRSSKRYYFVRINIPGYFTDDFGYFLEELEESENNIFLKKRASIKINTKNKKGEFDKIQVSVSHNGIRAGSTTSYIGSADSSWTSPAFGGFNNAIEWNLIRFVPDSFDVYETHSDTIFVPTDKVPEFWIEY